MKTYFIRGKSIALRPLRAEDLDGQYCDWLNDPEVCTGNNHQRYVYDQEQAEKFIVSANADRSQLVLAIEDLETAKHLGNIALQAIDLINRSAEISFLLGEKTYWGKGIGKEAGRLLIAHGFSHLNLHRIGCGTPTLNEGMIRLAGALGMKEEGRHRDAFYKHGEYFDILRFGILREEFNSLPEAGKH
ncbi:MAG: GNAT family protein [Verrucomicrobiota bacterium]